MWRSILVSLAAVACAMRPKAAEEPSFLEGRYERFDQLYRQYFKHYEKGTPRSMPGLQPHEIPLQFEFELPKRMYVLNMTPELLLLRGGITPSSALQAGGLGATFTSGSPYWYIEVDGLGSKHHQVIQALPEANSVVVRPQTVLHSSFARDLVKYFDKLHVPHAVHKTSFQFTVGVSLARMKPLLSAAMPHATRTRIHKLCRSLQCSDSYEGMLHLGSMVLGQAAGCASCGFPKRCQSPWLLRTHFGDLVRSLPEKERGNLTDDMLHAWGGDPDAPLYPQGIMDYLHFPEMAEVGGMVRARRGTENISREMPVEEDGLLQLASDMLSHENREQIDNRLRGRRCEVNGEQPTTGTWMAPSARQWLQAASLGQDLMSDHDSPTSKASLSRTLWRSMGQWRLSAEEPRIFLECRAPSKCLGKSDAKWAHLGYEGMLLETARAIHRFEHA
mmetsp:Transcript_121530/g.170993  ORF Transcript_121530/g.170993 Transcript_121530/m.170993 type:complete len:446 (-) Transcript_121530:112-1449(-)